MIVMQPITRTPRLILDVRDWLASVVAGKGEVEVPGLGTTRSIVRPTATLAVMATPATPRDPQWPFRGPVELGTVRTPSGILAFYGRVRSPGGGPFRQLLLEGTRCDLRIEAPGYRPTVLVNVEVPAKNAASIVREVFLYPTGELIDAATGPTLLTGLVTKADGSALEKRTRVEAGIPGVPPAETDENGVWLLELDPPRGPRRSLPGTVRLDFTGGVTHAIPAFGFEPRRLNRFPRTTLFGRVETIDGRNLTGATVEADAFLGQSTKTRADGTWLLALPLDQPMTGQRVVEVRVTPLVGAPVLVPAKIVKFGQANEIGLIIA